MAVSLGELFAVLGLDTSEFDRSIDRVQNSVGRASRRLQKAGKTMTLALSLPIAALGVTAVKAAADFETAMVEVQKVTDKTTADKLSNSIMEMANTIPLAQTELAGLAADAARFGIRGVENIESFTETVAKMAEATDLSSEVAGEALAKIAAQTNTVATQTENLGSAINELSNNFATSAGEIVNSMLRSSAAASNFGLSQHEIAGVSAQINAMSESAERAGTRIRSLFQELLDPGKVGEYAQAIGMTTQEFNKLRERSPRDALMALVEAFAAGGKEADNLRMITTRVSRQALTALAKNIGDTTRALDLSAQAFRENTSLQREFDAATKTFNAKWKLMQNRLREVGIEIGNKLIPIVLRIVNAIEKAVNWFSSLSTTAQNASLAFAGLVATLGPITTVLGTIGSALAALTVPIASVVAGVLAIGAAWIYVSENWEALKERFTDLTWWKATLSLMAKQLIDSDFGKFLRNPELFIAGKLSGQDLVEDIFPDLEDEKKDLEEYNSQFKELGSFMDAITAKGGKLANALNTIFQGASLGGGGGGSSGGGQESTQLSGTGAATSGDQFLNPIVQNAIEGEKALDRLGASVQRVGVKMQEVDFLTRKFGENAKMVAHTAAQGFTKMANVLGEALVSSEKSFKDLVGVALRAIQKIINQLLLQAIVGMLAGESTKGLPGLALAAVGIAGILALYNKHKSKVNDALITSDGSIVEFHPKDNILAMKDFSNLGMPSTSGLQGSGGMTMNDISGRFVVRGSDLILVTERARNEFR